MTLGRLVKGMVPSRWKEEIKNYFGVPSVGMSLRLLRANGFHPTVVIDVGAYRGDWAKLCNEIWPDASILMIEANPERAQQLQQMKARFPGTTAEQALLGGAPQPAVPFYEQESASSVLPEAAKEQQFSFSLPMRTLDEVTSTTRFQTPDLLKLDVQGYELEVLKGGERTLKSAEAVLLEVNFIEIYQGAPLLRDVVNHLGNAGFRAYDVANLYRRPLDKSLWQADMVFLRNGSTLVSSNRYQ